MSTPLYTPVVRSFAGAVGVHAVTTRWTYTVPVGKIAQLQAIHLRLSELIAKAFTTATINIQLNGVIVTALYSTAAITDHLIVTSFPLDLLAGDVLISQTSDGGAAGNLYYETFVSIREYS